MNQKSKLKKLNRILKKVRSFEPQMKKQSDEELSGLTLKFKERLAKGETLDAILPEAYAAICEADARILEKRPYDVQVIGAIALHQGYLAEMNTGEGKTLVATMPLYLNALTGKSTILVTTNEYLAKRDADEMGQVYRFMGLSVCAGVSDKPDERMTNKEKKQIYDADIVYTTHGVLGFDYLFNNLVTAAEERFMRELYYVIIDEADSVLLDSAQVPLVISGSPRVQSNLYELCDFFVTTLVAGVDFEKEDRKVWLTKEGVRQAEHFFEIDNFYASEYFEINRHVILALRAHALFEKEKEYVVSNNGEIILLDGGSGRMMPGVKLRGGMHQALEVKEKLKLSNENRSVASITYQNLFLLFEKMAGMSGTIADATEELRDVYQEDVIVIPPNCPVKRVDYPDLYFRDAGSQFTAAIDKVLAIHKRKQPVLVVVSSIAETELVSKILVSKKIAHSVLNANNAYWEAEIIKEAGQMGAVTVATSMAGRGTDIKLGDDVRKLGGLAVIGIGRMANIRQERQARGRAGRQGDPGFSQFYVSLEDEVVERIGESYIEKYVEGKKRIRDRKLRKVINSSQSIGEEFAIQSRKQAMEYDRVLENQRNLIYDMRDALLDGDGIAKETLMRIAKENICDFLRKYKKPDLQTINRYILDNLSYHLEKNASIGSKRMVEKYLLHCMEQGYDVQEEKLGSSYRMQEFMRIAVLSAIDDAWVEQVDYLQQLQTAVSGRASAQRNLIYEYQQDALESFHKMEKSIKRNIVRNILLSDVYVDDKYKLHMLLP